MGMRILQAPDGSMCPSVTTILDVINKPFLIQWANRLGKEGKDVDNEKEKAARGGTAGHEMIQHTMGGEPICEREFSAAEIAEGKVVLQKFLTCKGSVCWTMDTILMEERLFSKYGFCGAMDWYGKINGELTLLDFKTGRGISPEYVYQLAAYKKLLNEYGHKVRRVRILRLGRKMEWSLQDFVIPKQQLAHGWKVFLSAFKLWKEKISYEEEYEKRWR